MDNGADPHQRETVGKIAFKKSLSEDLTEEDLRKIAISKEQSKLGLTSKSEDVFKRIQEKRSKQWK